MLVLVLLAFGLFLARREIGDRLAHKLNERLAAEGIFVSWQYADLIPGPGIVLHDLALYRDAAKKERIALLGNVTALKGDPGWSRWDTANVSVRDSRLTLGSGLNETRLEHLDLQLRIEPGTVDLQQLQASVQGLRVKAKGTRVKSLLDTDANKKAAPISHPASQDKGLFGEVDLAWLKPVQEWLTFDPHEEEPVLQMEFLSRPDGLGVDVAATLHGKMFTWQGRNWDFIEAAVKTSFGSGKTPIEIEYARIGYAGQAGEFKGGIDPASNVLSIATVDSGFDLLALARAFVPDAAESLARFNTTGGWRVTGSGEIPLEHLERSRCTGRVELAGELLYAEGETRVGLQNPAFGLGVEANVVSVVGFTAGLWDGRLEVPMLQLYPATADRKSRIEMQLMLTGAQLKSVLGSFGPTQEQPGILQLDWKGGGDLSPISLTGAGTLSLQNAGLFREPQQDSLKLTGNLNVSKDQSKSVAPTQDTVSITLADGRFSFGSGREQTNLEQINLQLQLQPTATALQHFQARLQDLKIEASGTTHKKVASAASEKGTAKKNEALASKSELKKPDDPLPEPESKGGLFAGVHLDGLLAVKEWLNFQPEKDVPVLKLNFASRPKENGIDISATLEGRKFTWQGLKWDLIQAAAKTSFGTRKSTIVMDQVRMGYAGQTAEFTGNLDPASAVLRIDRMDSGIDVLAFSRALLPDADTALADLKSTGSWRMSGKGQIPLKTPKNLGWDGSVLLGGDLIYAQGKSRIAIQKPSGLFKVQQGECSFTDLKARLWEGTLNVPVLNVHLPRDKKSSRFETQFAVRDAKLEPVIDSFGAPQKQPGILQCDWKGGGEFDVNSLEGTGILGIEHAEFGRMPLFGGLGRLLDKLTPGFGRDTSTRLSLTHRIDAGTLHMNDLILECQQAKIMLEGTIDLKKNYVHMTGKSRGKALIGLVTSPLRSETAVTGKGPMSAVEWDTQKQPGTGILGRTIKAIGGDEDDSDKPKAKTGKKKASPQSPQGRRE